MTHILRIIFGSLAIGFLTVVALVAFVVILLMQILLYVIL